MTNDATAGEPVPPGTPSETGPAPSGAGSASPPPPSAPPPPPYGGPPPSGPGLAARYGLVRPLHGRYVAGVCAAVARATNTDPVLWRVLVAGLTLFGGIGLLLYLIGWLLIPAEGDTASPMEALVGKGTSNTSPLTVVLVTVLSILVLVYVVSDGFRVAVLGVVAVIAAVVLFQRDNKTAPGAGAPGAPGAGVPGTGGPPAAVASSTPDAGGFPPPPPPPPPPAGYRPPFAPHGPYASLPPPPVAPPPPRPPGPPRERSVLGRIVLSLVCLALGGVAVADLATGQVPASAYFAVALAVVGIGLLIGAWLGRARWLIVLGLVLTVVLTAVSVAEAERFDPYRRGRVVTWQPASIAELDRAYRTDFGDATLDLRGVDFAAASGPVHVDVNVHVGRLQVLLPANVDADVTADVDVGDANVLGQHWGGIDTPSQRVQDAGPDGTGGGRLVLDARLDVGNLEVGR